MKKNDFFRENNIKMVKKIRLKHLEYDDER
jgi:hypothetical protein